MLSHPLALVNVQVELLLLVVYVLPSIHVYESQAVCTSVPVFEFVIVKSRVTVLSHPLALVNVQVALLLLVVYVLPSIQV